jgi:translation initiation factor IF-3
MPTNEALAIAREQSLDLVEVSSGSDPPVCRIMDFGRYKYTMSKKQQEARQKSARTQLKEVKIRPKTEEHDLNVKLKKARKFLEGGNRLKLSMMFRGREMAYSDRGRESLLWFAGQLDDLAHIESDPKMEGRHLIMTLAPKSVKS